VSTVANATAPQGEKDQNATVPIEREIPGASELSREDLAGIAAASSAVVDGLDVPSTWITSYVAGDKVYCVHEAESVEVVVLEHARRGGFPASAEGCCFSRPGAP
jgi:Nickel responsive protein SCO4226-like